MSLRRRIDTRPQNDPAVKAGMKGLHRDMSGNVIGGYTAEGQALGTKKNTRGGGGLRGLAKWEAMNGGKRATAKYDGGSASSPGRTQLALKPSGLKGLMPAPAPAPAPAPVLNEYDSMQQVKRFQLPKNEMEASAFQLAEGLRKPRKPINQNARIVGS